MDAPLLTRCGLYRYTLPLHAPLTLAGTSLSQRSGLLIRLESEQGRVGWGEAAPLPGFSLESLDAAATQLRALGPAFVGRPALLASLNEASLAGFTQGAAPLHPSVEFGLALALAHLEAAGAGHSLGEWLLGAPPGPLYLNGLLTGSPAEMLRDAAQLRGQGYRSIKLKVGRRPVAEDVALVDAVADCLGPAVALRLDANRAWTLDEARAFIQATAHYNVAYIEEPLADPGDLSRLAAEGGHPLALDESLLTRSAQELGLQNYVHAVILKPMLLGWHKTLALARNAVALGIEPVLSASFESGVGMIGLVALATALTPGTPAGFDTYRRLAQDVVTPPLTLAQPQVDTYMLFHQPRTYLMEHLSQIS